MVRLTHLGQMSPQPAASSAARTESTASVSCGHMMTTKCTNENNTKIKAGSLKSSTRGSVTSEAKVCDRFCFYAVFVTFDGWLFFLGLFKKFQLLELTSFFIPADGNKNAGKTSFSQGRRKIRQPIRQKCELPLPKSVVNIDFSPSRPSRTCTL